MNKPVSIHLPCGCVLRQRGTDYYEVLGINWFCAIHPLKPLHLGHG